jgi:predicted 3-demethylubiquinone-9 3-methyltransferase (glyoxalase superfamily)
MVSREQINEIIQGRIVNVRFALNGTRMINYKVENNRFSEALSQQLEVLDGNKTPMSGDIDRYIVPLQIVSTER